MIGKEILTTQHREIEGVIEEIRGCLNRQETAKDARITKRLLCNLISRLNNHTLLEDGQVYPALLESSSKPLRDLAESFQSEMEGIRESYTEFFGKWIHVEMIEDHIESFNHDANMIFNSLIRRFAQEEKELFPKATTLVKAASA
ncbi:MAG: hemerythrin domain-containing protein [bacterium]|nr:hemerythrin domain-containing protein [bacterium]